MLNDAQFAKLAMRRIDELGRVSDEPDKLTRVYGSPAMRRANDLVAGWMRDAGMTVREDAIGNVIGHYPASAPGAKIFLLGSHLDTVRDAGKFDGPLGVLVAIACVQRLHEAKARLPFAVEVIGFADEEGVRFQSTYLGSRALAGTFNADDLKRADANGVTLGEAILHFGGDPAGLYGAQRDPDRLLGYAEVHIEQGPVLEERNLPVEVVTGIAGQSRFEVVFTGRAAHAGTTPMKLRRDALAGAAHFITLVESHSKSRKGLVATVGQVEVQPGASNVIPGRVRLTLDVRHAEDIQRTTGCDVLQISAQQTAKERGLQVAWSEVQSTPGVACSPQLSALLKQAAVNAGFPQVPELPSGAGHDAAAMAAITPIAMLFVRCKGGVSHHPDESVAVEDVRVAISVMNDFLQLLAKDHAST